MKTWSEACAKTRAQCSRGFITSVTQYFHCALSCCFVKYLNQKIRHNSVLLEATQGTLVVIAYNAVTELAERVLTPLHATLSGYGRALWESCSGNGSIAVFAVGNDWTRKQGARINSALCPRSF